MNNALSKDVPAPRKTQSNGFSPSELMAEIVSSPVAEPLDLPLEVVQAGADVDRLQEQWTALGAVMGKAYALGYAKKISRSEMRSLIADAHEEQERIGEKLGNARARYNELVRTFQYGLQAERASAARSAVSGADKIIEERQQRLHDRLGVTLKGA